MLFTAYGCFKEDTPIEPVSRNGIHISRSIYNFQSFYDLSSDSIVSNANQDWDLAFEASAEGWRIRINYSNFLGIYRTGSTAFNESNFQLIDKNWLYDASSGNPDSTAIGKWQDITGGASQVYLLGSYDGVRYKAFCKLRFLDVTDTSYIFEYSKMDNSEYRKAVVSKNNKFNYMYYSIPQQKQVTIEPPKNNWDILFTQYTTTLYTSQGVPTPYIVRGVYINPNQVAVMSDTVTGYQNLSSASIVPQKLVNVQDIIGYDWKAVEINQSANTARYAVRKNNAYIIRDTHGYFYKLRFLSYVNDSLRVGYPMFEKEKI